MSNRLNLSVTRSNLLKIREELDFAQEGHDLLEQKREVLLMEVMARIGVVEKLRKEAEQALQKAYRAFEEAWMVLGKDCLERASLAIPSPAEIHIQHKSIMGVILPEVDYSRREATGQKYGFLGTSASLDQAAQQFDMVLEKLAKLAEADVSLWRLATELQKTQCRANALNNLIIPEYRETVSFLENTLDDREREEFVVGRRIAENHKIS